MSEMTRTERNDLASLARKRARVAKDAARQRAAEVLADAEEQLAAVFKAEDERWKTAVDLAKEQVKAANQHIESECIRIGVPEDMRPKLALAWYERGRNDSAGRRSELRILAKARVDAQLKTALARIEAASVEIQTQLLAAGLDTDAARRFLESMPTPEELLPEVAVDELAAARQKRIEGA